MNDFSVITICTKSHIPNAFCALDSIKKRSSINIDLIVIVTDIDSNFQIDEYQIYKADGFTQYYKTISNKYGKNSNETRWTLKPFCMMEALKIYKKVIYIDPDIYFVSDIKDVFSEVSGVLLTPHFRNFFEHNDINRFLFTHGYFNAGFVGSLKNDCCIECLKWWGKSCMTRCEKNLNMGLHDDQKYLELMFIEFDCVHKTNNRGMNIAGWNVHGVDFEKIKPIFFHFSPSSDNCTHPVYQKELSNYKSGCEKNSEITASLFC